VSNRTGGKHKVITGVMVEKTKEEQAKEEEEKEKRVERGIGNERGDEMWKWDDRKKRISLIQAHNTEKKTRKTKTNIHDSRCLGALINKCTQGNVCCVMIPFPFLPFLLSPSCACDDAECDCCMFNLPFQVYKIPHAY
jgi:hypothetical protein